MELNVKITTKQIIYGILLVLLFVWILCSQIKCNNLKRELNEEKIKNLEQIDSLNYINKQHLEKIKEYELQISYLKSDVDSLNKVKNKIIIQKDEVIVSDNVSDAVNQLKDNLNKWKN